MKIKELTLKNGMIISAIEKSESIINEVWSNNYYEKNLIINQGMIIIDFGANQGFFSLYAASKGAKVFSYEPEKTNYKILLENVKRNNLTGLIKCRNYAIGKEAGLIDLFLQDYDISFASGMVSTSKRFVSKISDGNKSSTDSGITSQTVQCVTLDTVIGEIGEDEIDLLKIDCEGAELDILSGASYDKLIKVKNIVMETHDVYPFHEIFYKLEDLGFRVISFEKPSGKLNLGYVFATNKKMLSEPISSQGAIALLEIPHYALKYDAVSINASQSFSFDRKCSLEYEWFLNDVFLKNTTTSEFKYSFDSCGPFRILVKVKDSKCNVDEDQKIIWIFDRNYSQSERFIEMPDRGIAKEYSISGDVVFKLMKSNFPDTWLPDKLLIGITRKEFGDSILKYKFNGNEIRLNGKYNEIEFINFPMEMDLIFSFIAEQKEIIDIKWWWTKQSEKEIKPTTDGDILNVGAMSSQACVLVDNETKFKIQKEAFPSDWSPKLIKIGISALPTNDSNKKLNGSFVYGKVKKTLDDWYTEITIQDINFESDINFQINIAEKRKVKIVWWAE